MKVTISLWPAAVPDQRTVTELRKLQLCISSEIDPPFAWIRFMAVEGTQRIHCSISCPKEDFYRIVVLVKMHITAFVTSKFDWVEASLN